MASIFTCWNCDKDIRHQLDESVFFWCNTKCKDEFDKKEKARQAEWDRKEREAEKELEKRENGLSEKVPDDEPSPALNKGNRKCGKCGKPGHNSRTCKNTNGSTKKPRKKQSKCRQYSCGKCGKPGHNARTCKS